MTASKFEMLQQMLAEADKIIDPVEREQRIAEIMLQVTAEQPSMREQVTQLPIAPPTEPVEEFGPRMGEAPPKPLYGPRNPNPPPLDPNVMPWLKDEAEQALEPKSRFVQGWTDEQLANELTNPMHDMADPDKEVEEEIEKRKEWDASSTLSNLGDLRYLSRLAAQAPAVVGESILAPPALLALGDEFLGYGGGGIPGIEGDKWLENIRYLSDRWRKDIGVTQPRDWTESLYGIASGGVIPIKGAQFTSTLGRMLELATPFTIGGGGGRAFANFTVQFGLDQAVREVIDEGGDPYETAFDASGITGAVGDFSWPKVTKYAMGGVALASLAGMGIPLLHAGVKKYRSKNPFVPKPIRPLYDSGPDNLNTIERAGDEFFAKTIDQKQPLMDMAQRAGVADFEELSKQLATDTAAEALMKVNEFMKTGKLRGTHGQIDLDVPIDMLYRLWQQLPQAEADQVLRYLHMKDYEDQIGVVARGPQATAQDVFELAGVRQQVAAIEARSPLVKQFSDMYNKVSQGVADFMAAGPFPMISAKRAIQRQQDNRNFVPSDIRKVNPSQSFFSRSVDELDAIGESLNDYYRMHRLEGARQPDIRINPFEALNTWARNAAKAKLEHDAAGQYIEAMLNTGKNLIRKATKKEIGDPSKRDWLITRYEDGAPVTYITGRLAAHLLKFDTYFSKYPINFTLKRAYEHGTTGPLTVTFGLVTAIRDTFLGLIQREKGVARTGPISVTVTAVDSMFNKLRFALSEHLIANGGTIPFMNPQAVQIWAHEQAQAYMNTIYHLAQVTGGSEASLMKHNVVVNRGKWEQGSKSIEHYLGNIPGANFLGYPPKLMWKMLEGFFSSYSEAPRQATFANMIKAGVEPREALIKAKRITGDATRQGNAYNKYRKQYASDAQNKWARYPVHYAAWASQLASESLPFVNPFIQGMRRTAQAMIENPVKYQLRMWGYAGLPTLFAYAWNEFLGPEGNDYAFEQRSSQDIALRPIYIRIPGLPPEQGLTIPVAHEALMYASPFSAALHSFMRGNDDEHTRKMFMHMVGTVMSKAALPGYPVGLSINFAMTGQTPPESVLDPWDWDQQSHDITEKENSVLGSNLDAVLRAIWGTVVDTGSVSLAAFHEGGPEAFWDELRHSIAKRVPVIGPLISGGQPATSNFTPDSELAYKKTAAVQEFTKRYRELIVNGRGNIGNPEKKLTDPKDKYEDNDALSKRRMARPLTANPENPIFIEFGEIIKNTLDNNEAGWAGLEAASDLYGKQVRQLKSLTAGSSVAQKEWQDDVVGKDAMYQRELAQLNIDYPTHVTKGGNIKRSDEGMKKEKQLNAYLGNQAKLDRFYKDNKLDLSKREDIVKAIGYMERERIRIRKIQNKMITDMEDYITMMLKAEGRVKPDFKFDVTKHLGENRPPDIALKPVQGPPTIPNENSPTRP